MSLIGKTLVHYEITAEIGRGGMGEVYQAKDTKLGRDVAIKVLPEEFALDKDRVARFQREAKLLASLNHPNIAAIYGLEESDGIHFLVMELIEGDTLRDRIKSGPIPVEEALNFALQMTEALEAAHDKGVIHRDLKPANIKVTPDGMVKILDFGLAKAYVGDPENLTPLDSPTISAVATQQGVILGTAAYMSPEQARGKPVDKRADIWAFGVVLYEMLTGKKAFPGDDVTDTLAAVIRSVPEWKSLPANLHWRVKEVLERCLEKKAKDRYSGISDARVDIKKTLADPKGMLAHPVDTIESRAKIRTAFPWAAAVLGIIIVAVVIWNLRTPEPQSVSRFYHELPEDQEFTNPGRPLVSVSPDGTKIVYVANQQLYLRNFDELIARPIQGTEENPTTPFFSPDGQWVGYWSSADAQLKKITVSGGAPVTLCDATNPHGVTWGDDGTILFGQEAGIMSVSANGGTAELLIKKEANEGIYGPQILPNKEWVMFTFTEFGTTRNWDEAQIVVQSLKSVERKVLVSGGSDARYVPTGHLIYALGGVLHAIAFDIDELEVTGGAASVVEGVRRARGAFTGTANYGFSETGMLAYVFGTAESGTPPRSLVWVDREGKAEELTAPPQRYTFPRISPDGKQVALGISDPDNQNQEIFIWDEVRKTLNKRTYDKSGKFYAIWTPDGERIVYHSRHEDSVNGGVYWRPANGTGEAEKLASDPDRFLRPYSFSSDGKYLLMIESATQTNTDISILSMEDDRERIPLLQTEFVEALPIVSPDNQYIAYLSQETGQAEIFVRPFPNVNKGKWQVSQDGGTCPLWSPDGRELFYLSFDNSVMAVEVETRPTFDPRPPRILFQSEYIGYTYTEGPPWDIHPDGKRFLMMKSTEASSSTEAAPRPKIIIVQNWFEELKQRVPVDK